MNCTEEKIREIAARLVLDGLKKSAALNQEAWQEYRMAIMMNRHEGSAQHKAAHLKFQRAARILALCGKLAAAHGVGPKANGRGCRPSRCKTFNTETDKENTTCATTWQ